MIIGELCIFIYNFIKWKNRGYYDNFILIIHKQFDIFDLCNCNYVWFKYLYNNHILKKYICACKYEILVL